MNQKGFSLIEVVLSLAIISIIVVPFTQIFINSTYTSNLSKREIQATYLAQKYMEEAKEELSHFLLTDLEDLNTKADGTMFKEANEQGFNIITEYKDVTLSKGNSSIVDGSIEPKDPDFNLNISIDNGDISSIKFDNVAIPIINPHDISLELSADSINEDQTNILLESSTFFLNSYNYSDEVVGKVLVEGDGTDSAGMSIYNLTSRKLILYEFDDSNNNLDLDMDEGEAEIIKNLNTSTSTDTLNLQRLYEVQVTVYFEGKEYERIVSQIRN